MKKDKPIKVELNDTQIDFSDVLITDCEILEDNNQIPVPVAELTQNQQIPFLIRPSFTEVNSPNTPPYAALVEVPSCPMGYAQTVPKPLIGGVFAFVVLAAMVIVDNLPPILYVFRRKNKNKILELEVSCPFLLNDFIMSAISKDDVAAGEVGIVTGIKYKPLRAVVDFSTSFKHNLSNKEYLIKKTKNQGLRIVFSNKKIK